MTFDPTNMAATVDGKPKSGGRKAKANQYGKADDNAGGATSLAAEPPAETEAAAGSVILEVPIGIIAAGYTTPNVAFKCTPRQALAAKMLWCSLSDRGDRFAGGRSSHPDGTTVEGINDGMRWLLDRLADSIEAETGTQLTEDQ